MKIYNFLVALTLLFSFSPIFAQVEKPKPIKRISVNEMYIFSGTLNDRNTNATLLDFKKLAPQSVLLSSDFTGYSSANEFSTIMANTVFAVMLGIQFSDKQKLTYKANPVLRLGISYGRGPTLTGNLSKQNRKPYDTLTSSQTGQKTFIDSVSSTNYFMRYSSEQLRFEGSLIFRTKPENRWSIYSGIGITAGLSINARTDIDYNNFEGIGNQNANTFSSAYYFGSNNQSETFRNKTNLGILAYIPLGVDFRIGKKREFWKRTHLFYELRPSVNFTSIPEFRTITNAAYQQGLGLKVSW